MRSSVIALFLLAFPPQGTDSWRSDSLSTSGWRSIHRGMTIEEAIGAVDGQASRDKDAKYSDGSVRQRVKLADKVRHDGINYDVTFRFDSTGRLDQVVFFSNKVKKESFDEVVKVFLELYGPPTSDSTKTGPASYSAGPETVRTLSWKKEGANLYATSAEQQLGPFVKGRLISIAMTYTRD